MQISYHPAALREIIAEVRYYDERSAGLGRAFANAVDEAVQLMRANPLRFGPGSHGTRRCPIGRFPHLIAYRIEGETIRIYAVAHPKRRPDYWRERLS